MCGIDHQSIWKKMGPSASQTKTSDGQRDVEFICQGHAGQHRAVSFLDQREGDENGTEHQQCNVAPGDLGVAYRKGQGLFRIGLARISAQNSHDEHKETGDECPHEALDEKFK